MAGWICLLSLAVKVRPLPAALAMVTTSTRQPSSNYPSAEYLASLLDRILRTKFLCFEPICWKRAAILHRYLALNGRSTQIVFGMRKEPDGIFRGHAWLEAEGSPILEASPPEYTATYTYPSSAKFNLELSALS
jgi:hypothetical protein